jgi:hypothetical protein
LSYSHGAPSVQKQVVQNLLIMELRELFHFQIAFHLTYVLDYRQEAIFPAHSLLINARKDLHANYPSRMMRWLCKGVFCPILPFSLSVVKTHLLSYLYFFFTFLSSTNCMEFRNVIQGDQKVSLHLMITMHYVSSNVQSVPRQSPDIY